MVAAPETTTSEMKDVVSEVKEVANTKEENESKSKEAVEKMSFGKKAMLLNSPQEAVEHFAEACALMASVHGDMAKEMCDYHFNYGKALLEVARLEENVLGNALTGVPEDSELEDSQVEDPDKLTVEEKEEVADEVDKALKENFEVSAEKKETEKAAEPGKSDKKVEENTDDDKKDEDKKDEEKTAVEDEEVKESKMEIEEVGDKDDSAEKPDIEEKENSEEETEEDEAAVASDEAAIASDDAHESTQDEDVSTLQLAYEVLELSKTIYERIEERTEEENLKLSQVYLKLGEVASENEQYEESVTQYGLCLNLQETLLAADDRLLAETNYQLGLAHSFADNFDPAVKHIESAVNIIKTRISNKSDILAKQDIDIKEDMDMSKLSTEVVQAINDVKDMQKVLPELEEKIADIKETKTTCIEKIKSLKATFEEAMVDVSKGTSAFGTSDFEAKESNGSVAKPISTSMIRKKRKPEEEVTSEEASKKPRIESTNEAAVTEKVETAEV